jgi:uncharacterized protein (TIGR03000 family)
MYSVVLMMALSGGAEAPAFCHGCSGCSGSCSCSGSCHGRFRLFGGHHRCHGCHGCSGCSGGCCGGEVVACCGGAPACTGCCGGVIVAPPVAPPPAVKPMPKETIPAPKPNVKPTAAPATLVVSLPAEARLTIDGATTRSTTSTRLFVSPTLQPGQDYVYTLRAEIVRDGQTVAQEQRVTVRAGEETQVPFTFAQGVVASR